MKISKVENLKNAIHILIEKISISFHNKSTHILQFIQINMIISIR